MRKAGPWLRHELNGLATVAHYRDLYDDYGHGLHRISTAAIYCRDNKIFTMCHKFESEPKLFQEIRGTDLYETDANIVLIRLCIDRYLTANQFKLMSQGASVLV